MKNQICYVIAALLLSSCVNKTILGEVREPAGRSLVGKIQPCTQNMVDEVLSSNSLIPADRSGADTGDMQFNREMIALKSSFKNGTCKQATNGKKMLLVFPSKNNCEQSITAIEVNEKAVVVDIFCGVNIFAQTSGLAQ